MLANADTHDTVGTDVAYVIAHAAIVAMLQNTMTNPFFQFSCFEQFMLLCCHAVNSSWYCCYWCCNWCCPRRVRNADTHIIHADADVVESVTFTAVRCWCWSYLCYHCYWFMIFRFFLLLRMLLLMTLWIPFDTGVTDIVSDVVQVVLVKLIIM